jgi:hypothetical protein
LTGVKLHPVATQPGMGRAFASRDPRNLDFLARGALWEEGAPLRDRVWRRGGPYDQGNSSTCVPHALKGLLNTLPFSGWASYYRRSRYNPYAWYPEFQRRDEWPGEAPAYEGTSAQGGLAYLVEQGLIREYRWHRTIDDVLATLAHHGPVAFGTAWRLDMFEPDNRGLIHATGSEMGGHEWEAIGLDLKAEEIIAMNSWGDWGDGGRFRLSFADAEDLLNDWGDAVTLVG